MAPKNLHLFCIFNYIDSYYILNSIPTPRILFLQFNYILNYPSSDEKQDTKSKSTINCITHHDVSCSIINRQIQLDLLANTTTIVIIKKKKMNKIIIVVVCDASWSMKQFCNDMMDYLQETDGENEKLNEETNALVLNPFVLK